MLGPASRALWSSAFLSLAGCSFLNSPDEAIPGEGSGGSSASSTTAPGAGGTDAGTTTSGVGGTGSPSSTTGGEGGDSPSSTASTTGGDGGAGAGGGDGTGGDGEGGSGGSGGSGGGEGGADPCGNGLLDEGEACDDGGESETCDDDCSAVECGDGVTNQAADEECDDEGESASCDANCTIASCGDGDVNATRDEECDDEGESDDCDLNCTFASCGDGDVNTSRNEACDDEGPSFDCDDDCTIAFCGDGTINAARGESCEDPDDDDGDACPTTCVAAFCGDGFTFVGEEECDDGGPDSLDGCTPQCVGEVFAYTGPQIVDTFGLADFTPFSSSNTPYFEGGMRFYANGAATVSSSGGCNATTNVFYLNGGANFPIQITRESGGQFGALELQGGNGYGTFCTDIGYAEVYLNGVLKGGFDLDGVPNETVYGFWGVFDEVRVAFYANTTARDAHNLDSPNAASVDDVRWGSR
jgi:hypothetical protein